MKRLNKQYFTPFLKTIAVCATDLLALCLLKTPKEIGAEIAFGNAQRFGVPLGYGGPHGKTFSSHKMIISLSKNLFC